MYYLWASMGTSGDQWEASCLPFHPVFSFWHNCNFIHNRQNVVFTGTYHRTLDDKLRVLMPKRLRCSLADDSGLYLTPGTDQCLELHTDESLQELANRVQQAKTSNDNVRSFSRLFYARASFCEFDKQGRIRIPTESAQWAGLEKEIVLVGVGFNWEIWNPPAWEAYLNQNSDLFDGLVNQTLSPCEIASTSLQSDDSTPLQKPR